MIARGSNMRREALGFLSLFLIPIAVAACSGGGGGGGDDDDDDDDGSTPPPAGTFRLNIDATPHPDQSAIFRMKRQGGAAPPIACSMTELDGTGQGVVTTGDLMAGETYNRIQLVLNLDGNDVLDIGVDHVYSYASQITASATTGVLLTFDHDDIAGTGWVGGTTPTDPPPQWNWVDGLGCPGE